MVRNAAFIKVFPRRTMCTCRCDSLVWRKLFGGRELPLKKHQRSDRGKRFLWSTMKNLSNTAHKELHTAASVRGATRLKYGRLCKSNVHGRGNHYSRCDASL